MTKIRLIGIALLVLGAIVCYAMHRGAEEVREQIKQETIEFQDATIKTKNLQQEFITKSRHDDVASRREFVRSIREAKISCKGRF